MAERAPRTREQRTRRRVVQIHIVTIRKHELHAPQRVVRPGPLAQTQFARRQQPQIPGCGRGDAGVIAGSRGDLVAVALDPARVSLDLRQQFLLQDAVRHVPVRLEHHVSHVGGEHRGPPAFEGFSDDHVHPQEITRVVSGVPEREQPELGHVHEDGGCVHAMRQPARALHG
jgi:hypothetical protein